MRLSDTHRDDLLTAIKEKNCTPIIGQEASIPWIPDSKDISRLWAKKYGYPFEDSNELFRVAQFLAQDKADESFPKNILSSELMKIKPPDFSLEENRNTPYAVLADLNLPLYITTNYDYFMEEALGSRLKDPVTEFCRWNEELEKFTKMSGIPSVFDKDIEYESNIELKYRPKTAPYKPTEYEPLVYHLHGIIDLPQSMVLTEKDYLEFARTLNKDSEMHILQPVIRKALSITSLLFIGYRLDDLGFRTLFEELSSLYKGTSLTILLSIGSNTEASRAKEYFDRHTEHLVNASLYWGNTLEFSAELNKQSDKFRHLTR